MNAAKEAKSGDKIRFSHESQRCFYEGGSFLIAAWKQMNKDILRRAEIILSRRLLFRDMDTIDVIDPYSFVDQELNYNNGFSLAELIPDHGHTAREIVMNKLRLSCSWNSMIEVVNEEIVFLAEGKEQYTRNDEEFRELLLMAVNWTCGLTGRGMEMVSLLFENKQAAARNVFIYDGQIMITTEYHKSQAITEDIKV